MKIGLKSKSIIGNLELWKREEHQEIYIPFVARRTKGRGRTISLMGIYMRARMRNPLPPIGLLGIQLKYEFDVVVLLCMLIFNEKICV